MSLFRLPVPRVNLVKRRHVSPVAALQRASRASAAAARQRAQKQRRAETERLRGKP